MTPPPVVELLRNVIRLRELANSSPESIGRLRSLADSLSEITPERVRVLREFIEMHFPAHIIDRRPEVEGLRGIVAALSRISSGEAK